MKQQTAGALCLTVMVSDVMVSPFGRTEAFSARVTIGAIVLSTAILTVLVLLLLREKNAHKAGKSFAWLASGSLLLAAACAYLDTERFYRFCSDEPLPATVTLAVLLLLALYALRCGTQTLARTAEILIWLVGASLVLLLIANAGKMQVTNLQPAWQSAHSFWQACTVYLRFPAGLLLFWLVPDGQEKGLPTVHLKTIVWVLLLPAVLQIGNAMMMELVLGAGAQSYLQPSYTLARLGGLSVFRRLDALHLGIWLLALTMKSVILLCGAAKAFACCTQKGSAMQRAGLLVCALVVTIGLVAAASPELRQASVSAFVILSACVLCARGGLSHEKQ